MSHSSVLLSGRVLAAVAVLATGCATVPRRDVVSGDPPRSPAARAAYACAGDVIRRAGLPVVQSDGLTGLLQGEISNAAPLNDAGLNAGRQPVNNRPPGVANTTPYVVDGLTVVVREERGTGRALVSAWAYGGASAERTLGYTSRPPAPYLLESVKAAHACVFAPLQSAARDG